MTSNKKAIVVGSGILGMATARKLSIMGYSVTVIERSEKASGSSIRNFGMVWPIGQPQGELLERANISRSIWTTLCQEAGIWNNPCGSIQLFTNNIELELAESFYEQEKNFRNLRLLTKEECFTEVSSANKSNIVGGLWSDSEVIVESREAIRLIPEYLEQKHGIRFLFNTTVIEIMEQKARTNIGLAFEFDIAIICSGYETELLFPEYFKSKPITISQLNMLRSFPVIENLPAICAGLSFLHYNSYATIPGLSQYKKFCEEKYPDQVKYGIHLLVSQNYKNELTIGDSHDYGSHFEPFQQSQVDHAIMDYFNEVFNEGYVEISQHWMGRYLKMKDGSSELAEEIQPGIYVFNGPGGAGMTLGWGMAESILPKLLG